MFTEQRKTDLAWYWRVVKSKKTNQWIFFYLRHKRPWRHRAKKPVDVLEGSRLLCVALPKWQQPWICWPTSRSPWRDGGKGKRPGTTGALPFAWIWWKCRQIQSPKRSTARERCPRWLDKEKKKDSEISEKNAHWSTEWMVQVACNQRNATAAKLQGQRQVLSCKASLKVDKIQRVAFLIDLLFSNNASQLFPDFGREMKAPTFQAGINN